MCEKTRNFYEQRAASSSLTVVSELEVFFKSSYQHYFGPCGVNEFVESIVVLEEELRAIFRRNIKKVERLRKILKRQNYVGYASNLFVSKVNTFPTDFQRIQIERCDRLDET